MKLTNSLPLKIGLLPLKVFIFNHWLLNIDFQWQAVSFREGSTVSPPQILPENSPKSLYAKSQGTRMKNHKANQLLHVMQVVRHPKIKGRKILPFLPAQKCSQTKKKHREKWMRSPPWKKSKTLGGCFWGEVRNLFLIFWASPKKKIRWKKNYFCSFQSSGKYGKILMGFFYHFAPPDQQKIHAENQSFGIPKTTTGSNRKTPAFQYAFPIENGGFYSQSC